MLVKIETYFDGEFWCARGMGEDIFTQAKTLDQLIERTKEAIQVYLSCMEEPVVLEEFVCVQQVEV